MRNIVRSVLSLDTTTCREVREIQLSESITNHVKFGILSMDLHNFYENKKRDNKKYIYIKTVVGISQKNKQNSYYEEFSENRKVYEGVACKISNE